MPQILWWLLSLPWAYSETKLNSLPHSAKNSTLNFNYAAAAKLLQSCPALRDPMDCSPPGSSTHGIFQARTLEWVAIAFSEISIISNINFTEDF